MDTRGFLAWFSIAVFVGLLPATAQTFRTAGPGLGSIPLDGPWYFRTDYDPSWSSVTLKQSQASGWKPVQSNLTSGEQGPRLYGYAWYRIGIDIGAGPDTSLLIPPMDDIYEVFWNGAFVGRLPVCRKQSCSTHSTLPYTGSRQISQTDFTARLHSESGKRNLPATIRRLSVAPRIGGPAILELIRSGERSFGTCCKPQQRSASKRT